MFQKRRRRPTSAERPLDRSQSSVTLLEVSRLEYEELRSNIRDLSNDINRNYQWVMAAAAVLLGSQLLGSNWFEFQETLVSSPWILGSLAVITLWFPAYDMSRWSDMKVAHRYMTTVLVPRLSLLVTAERPGEVIMWDEFRDDWQARRKYLLMPIWWAKLALPYLPSVLALLAHVRLVERGIWRWTTVTTAWSALVLILLVCMLGTAVRLPGRSPRLNPTR